MYEPQLHHLVNNCLQENDISIAGEDNLFYTRFVANTSAIHFLYNELYQDHPDADFKALVSCITAAYKSRPSRLKDKDIAKEQEGNWFLSNEITGMSLYVDRFCGSLENLNDKLGYFKKLGVNLLHLMPLMESPQGESDGGYAVSDFRKVDKKFGDLHDLTELQEKMENEGMYLMLDVVLNHTSNKHEWALKAARGDRDYQDYYYMYSDRTVPDEFEKTMPEIFPESSPGNFTWSEECQRWVMTVFHSYQWDLNYTNPKVFMEMMNIVFFYANLGVDILRIDAPAFVWKELGTTCQNLPKAHVILRLIKQCIQVATPGMAILGEAIVAPKEIMKYFGSGFFTSKECDFAYNATQMAVQWDALATGDTKVMLAAQHELLQKPFGTSWITYVRCHDDIGLGYDDYMIRNSGFNPYEHRKFLKEYYSGSYSLSPASGALFSVNPKTQDARISGTLASLCGLEKAMEQQDDSAIKTAIDKILLMQAQSLFIGGIPMLFYGDEAGYINDYSYKDDPAKSYDNRWMHRPLIDWNKNKKVEEAGTVEERIFSGLQQLLKIRTSSPAFADLKNLTWVATHNDHVAAYLRTLDDEKIYCLFNFSPKTAYLSWDVFRQHGPAPVTLVEYISGKHFRPLSGAENIAIPAYQVFVMKEL
jgi:amylosucrase